MSSLDPASQGVFSLVPALIPQPTLEAVVSHSLGLSRGWVVDQVKWAVPSKKITIEMAVSSIAAWTCPICGKPAPLHDTVKKSWRHLDILSIETRVHARVPRTDCPQHGVHVVIVPWADPKTQVTRAFDERVQRLLAEGHRVATVAKVVGLSWDRVKRKKAGPAGKGAGRKKSR